MTRHETVQRTGSTNRDLVALAATEPHAWPHLSSLRAVHQDAGVGRAGRAWVTPAGGALTASVLVRTCVAAERRASLALVAGLAAARAVEEAAPPVQVRLKWPNDLVVDAGGRDVPGWGRLRKLGGVLLSAVPAPDPAGEGAVVAGVGVNLDQPAADLPVPWATSVRVLRPERPAPDPARVWTALLSHLAALLPVWEEADGLLGDLHQDCADRTATLGRPVQVTLPGGVSPTRGTAVALEQDGALRLRTAEGECSVRAGEIEHLRS